MVVRRNDDADAIVHLQVGIEIHIPRKNRGNFLGELDGTTLLLCQSSIKTVSSGTNLAGNDGVAAFKVQGRDFRFVGVGATLNFKDLFVADLIFKRPQGPVSVLFDLERLAITKIAD